MKRIPSILAAGLLAALAAASCHRPTVIPDDELALIFRDAYLSNAYANDARARRDSLRIYEPLFARYGYTAADVEHTIGTFSRRKSARLSDVVERAIDLLEEEGLRYEGEVAVLDTIDRVAQRTFTRTLLADSLLRVSSPADTARTRLVFDDEPGEYRVAYRYEIDSLDANGRSMRSEFWLENERGARSSVYYQTLRPGRPERFRRTFNADSTHRRLHIDLLRFTAPPRRPSIRFSDIEVIRIPPAAQAVDSLYLLQLNVRIFADEFLRAAAADSL